MLKGILQQNGIFVMSQSLVKEKQTGYLLRENLFPFYLWIVFYPHFIWKFPLTLCIVCRSSDNTCIGKPIMKCAFDTIRRKCSLQIETLSISVNLFNKYNSKTIDFEHMYASVCVNLVGNFVVKIWVWIMRYQHNALEWAQKIQQEEKKNPIEELAKQKLFHLVKWVFNCVEIHNFALWNSHGLYSQQDLMFLIAFFFRHCSRWLARHEYRAWRFRFMSSVEKIVCLVIHNNNNIPAITRHFHMWKCKTKKQYKNIFRECILRTMKIKWNKEQTNIKVEYPWWK